MQKSLPLPPLIKSISHVLFGVFLIRSEYDKKKMQLKSIFKKYQAQYLLYTLLHIHIKRQTDY